MTELVEFGVRRAATRGRRTRELGSAAEAGSVQRLTFALRVWREQAEEDAATESSARSWRREGI